MAPPPDPKRHCHVTPSPSPSPPPINLSLSLSNLLESVLLATSDPSVPLDLSLERILQSRDSGSDKERLIEVAVRVGSALVESAYRSARKLATLHNSVVWPLPSELTVKVLSFLDTASLCYASATCTTFSKCASDPLCYSHVDLTLNWPKVTDFVVSTVIQRAGQNLMSLDLGTKSICDSKGRWRDPPLTGSCLAALSLDNGASGALLQKLFLGRIFDLNQKELISTLSYCKSLKDFEIFALDVELEDIMKALSIHCHSVERLCFDYSNFSKPPIMFGRSTDSFIKGCNMLTSLSIIGCVVNDWVLDEILKGLPKLRFGDFSASIDLTGSFLKELGNDNGGGGCLETLILQECAFLNRDDIAPFFSDVLLGGKWKSLRFLDLTCKNRREFLVCGLRIREYFKQSRPEIRFLAEFLDRVDSSCEEIIDDMSQSGTDTSSASGDDVSQYDDSDQNSEYDDESDYDDDYSDDEVSQNGEDQIVKNVDDQNGEDQVAQNGDNKVVLNGEDKVAQNQNGDSSSSDDEAHQN